jgi:hypothetical protein
VVLLTSDVVFGGETSKKHKCHFPGKVLLSIDKKVSCAIRGDVEALHGGITYCLSYIFGVRRLDKINLEDVLDHSY